MSARCHDLARRRRQGLPGNGERPSSRTGDTVTVLLRVAGKRWQRWAGGRRREAVARGHRPDDEVTRCGFTFARSLREDPRFADIPMIIVSAVASQKGFDFRPAHRRGPGGDECRGLLRQARVTASVPGPREGARRVSGQAAAGLPESAAPPARILVVDDELGVREGCRKILAAEGYDVLTAGDGKAGLEQLTERGPFSVLLVDLQMPRMSGLELIHEARTLDPDIVPIIITAHATLDTAVEGTRQGAYSYIPKPFTPDELLLAIKNGLEKRALSLETRRLREEREKRLLEVAAERSRSTTIIAAMTDGILVINTEKLVVLRNNATARILPDCAHRPIPFPLDEIESVDVREIVNVVLGLAGRIHDPLPADSPRGLHVHGECRARSSSRAARPPGRWLSSAT